MRHEKKHHSSTTLAEGVQQGIYCESCSCTRSYVEYLVACKKQLCVRVCVCVLSSTIRLQFPAGTRRLLLLYLNMGAGISY